MTIDTKHAKAQLQSRMEAIIAANPVSVPREAQAEFDSCLSAIKVLEQVGKASLDGVDLNNVAITTGGEMVGRRVTDSQSQIAISERDSAATYTTAGSRNNGRLCSEMWNDHNPSKCGFSSLADEVRAIRYGDSVRMAAVGQTIGDPSGGGFAVAPSFEFATWDKSLEDEVVRPRCLMVPMTQIEHNVSTFDDNDHSAGLLFGGLKAEFLGEGDAINYKTAVLRRTKLYANLMGFLVASTNQLIQDSGGYEEGIANRMPQVLGWNLDRYCLIDGTGSGQPRSILNDPALIKVTRTSSAQILFSDLVNMFARLHPACLKDACWIVNQSAIPSLLQLSIPVGTAGTWIPAMTGTAGNYEMLTLPVVFTEKVLALGTSGDILLCSLSNYALGIVKNSMRLDMSNHVRFTTAETVFRVLARFDGQGTWKSSFTPKNGNPLSWAVALTT